MLNVIAQVEVRVIANHKIRFQYNQIVYAPAVNVHVNPVKVKDLGVIDQETVSIVAPDRALQ